jgi:WD40 repeat protein
MWMGSIEQADWDERSSRILTVSLTGTAEIWDSDTGQTIVSLSGHTDSVIRGVWDPSGERILTASKDGTARVWNPTSGIQVALLTGHNDAILDAAWNPEGDRVVTASDDGTARIWSVDPIDETLTLTNSVQERAYWNEDGTLIASSGYSTQIWDALSGGELTEFEGNFAVWSPAGDKLLFAMSDGSLFIWDTATPLPETALEQMVELVGHTNKVRHASWNNAGSHIVTASKDGVIRLWEASSGRGVTLHRLEGKAPTYSEWSRSGNGLLIAHPEGILVWDIQMDQGEIERSSPRLTLEAGAETFGHASWSPDETRIITTSDEGAVIWDSRDGGKVLELTGHTETINYAAWSSDGERVLTSSGDNTVRLWEANSGRTLHVLSGHTGPVDFAAWNPAGTLVVTASWDSTALVWDAISGKKLAKVSGYFDPVRHAAWSSDGSLFMTTSWGGPVRVFALPLGNTADAACLHAVRNLTADEWESYLGERPYIESCPGLP